MFEHSTKENFEGRLEIEDVAAETMEDVLQFVYTGTCGGLESSDAEVIVALHRVADRYFIRQLKAYCIALMPNGVTQENAAELWEEAQFFGLERLKQAVRGLCWT